MLARVGLREEGVEGVVADADAFVRGHLTVRLDPMFQTFKRV